MKKERTLLIVLLAVLIVCAGVYAGLKAWNGGADDREDAQATRVASMEDISEISFTNQYGTFSFTLTDGTWAYADDPDFPLDGSYLDTLAGTLSDLKAVRAFPSPDALAGYGLDQPAGTISAGNGSGEQVTIFIGNTAGSGYYAKVDGEQTVYTISSALPDAMQYKLNDLAVIAPIPAALEESLTQIEITQGETSVLLTKETVTAEPPAETDAPAESAQPVESQAPVTEYHWYKGETSLDQNGILSSALSTLAGMSFTACHDYKPDGAALAACGLDSPTVLTVTAEGSGYTLEIGAASESGGYYARLDGSGPIYLLGAGDAESLTALLGLTGL